MERTWVLDDIVELMNRPTLEPWLWIYELKKISLPIFNSVFQKFAVQLKQLIYLDNKIDKQY